MKQFNDLSDTQKQMIAEVWCREIAHFVNETTLVEFVLQHSLEFNSDNIPFTYDDIVNYNNVGYLESLSIELTREQRDKKLEFYEYLRNKLKNYHQRLVENSNNDCITTFNRIDKTYDKVLEIDSLCIELESLDVDPPEIMSWFHCSRYAGELLARNGGCVLNETFYGRQCYNQAIYSDYNIQIVAFHYYCEYNTDYITDETLTFLKAL